MARSPVSFPVRRRSPKRCERPRSSKPAFPKGIAANAIAPGFFLTDGNAPFFSQPRVVDLARRIPLQRVGRPDELVGAAIFLASDAASYITGQVLTVDAGLSVAP